MKELPAQVRTSSCREQPSGSAEVEGYDRVGDRAKGDKNLLFNTHHASLFSRGAVTAKRPQRLRPYQSCTMQLTKFVSSLLYLLKKGLSGNYTRINCGLGLELKSSTSEITLELRSFQT